MGYNHCKHYLGREILAGDGKCAVGIDPRVSFCDGNNFGMFKRIPCIRTNVDTPKCGKAEWRTKEEAEREEAEFEAYVSDFMKVITTVRPAIEAEHKATGAWSGKLDCPKCSKPLHWSKAQCNGHVWGRCETPDCVSWME